VDFHQQSGTCRRGQTMAALAVVSLLVSAAGCGMVATGQNTAGVRLYQQGQYYAAMDKFQSAMRADPNDADAYYNLAATVHQLGKSSKNQAMLQQAETLYNQCLDRDPDHTECYRGLAVLLGDTDRADRAFALMKNWSLRSPENANPRIELARLYEERKDKKSAETQLQQALQLDQSNPRAWAALASLRESEGDYQQALANYERAYSLNNFQPAIGERIAALNQATGRTSGDSSGATNGTRTVNAAAPPAARY
jgi:tetratricopeptide (TPR) repeat protein